MYVIYLFFFFIFYKNLVNTTIKIFHVALTIDNDCKSDIYNESTYIRVRTYIKKTIRQL